MEFVALLCLFYVTGVWSRARPPKGWEPKTISPEIVCSLKKLWEGFSLDQNICFNEEMSLLYSRISASKRMNRISYRLGMQALQYAERRNLSSIEIVALYKLVRFEVEIRQTLTPRPLSADYTLLNLVSSTLKPANTVSLSKVVKEAPFIETLLSSMDKMMWWVAASYSSDFAQNSSTIDYQVEAIAQVNRTYVLRPQLRYKENTDDQIAISKIDNVGNAVKAASFYYKTLHTIIPPTNNKTKYGIIDSRVFAASLFIDGKEVNFTGKVRISLNHIKKERYKRKGVFMNYTEKGPEWSDAGCQVEDSNENRTVFYCNHLTNFAILITGPKEWTNKEVDHEGNRKKAMAFVSCSFPLVGGLLTIAALIISRIRSRETVIGLHFSICLINCNILILVIMAHPTDNQAFCEVMATVTHYFAITAILWILNLSLCSFLQLISKGRCWSLNRMIIFAYGCSLLLIGCAYFTGPGYGHEKYCINPESGDRVGLYTFPLTVLVTSNATILAIVIESFRKLKQINAEERQRKAMACAYASGALATLVSMNVVIGLLSLTNVSLIFSFIFLVSSLSLAFGTIITNCYSNPEVRKGLKDRLGYESTKIEAVSEGKTNEESSNRTKRQVVKETENECNASHQG